MTVYRYVDVKLLAALAPTLAKAVQYGPHP